MTDTLDADRNEAADREFEAYVFGDASEPEGADGWERTSPGNEWTRTVWFAPYEGEGDSVKGHFTVVFEERSASISAAWASVDGNDVGRRAEVAGPGL